MAEDMQQQPSEAGDKGRDTFIMRLSWFEGVKDLLEDGDADNANALLFAICEYAFNGVEPNFKGLMLANWRTIKNQIDKTAKTYNNCVINGQKGAKYGIYGGRGKKKETPKETPKETSKETPNETPNETGKKPLTKPLNDNVNEDEDENVNENEEEMSFCDFLIHDIGFLGSVAAKYPELKADGVRAMLTQFHNCSKVDKSADNSITKYKNHFKNWLKYQSPITREQTQRNLNARAEGERQAAERDKQYEESSKNAMAHEAAINDPRYIETMAMLEAEG